MFKLVDVLDIHDSDYIVLTEDEEVIRTTKVNVHWVVGNSLIVDDFDTLLRLKPLQLRTVYSIEV